jgi:hypothetical protein
MLSTEFGSQYFWRGFQIGCYTCHFGPAGSDTNPNRPAVVSNGTVSTRLNTPVNVALQASDPDGNILTLRIVSQSANGTVGLNGTVATYFPDTGFTGNDQFTFAAWDGSTDSNLGTITVSVNGQQSNPTATPTPVARFTPTATLPARSTATPPPRPTATSTLRPTATTTRVSTPAATATRVQTRPGATATLARPTPTRTVRLRLTPTPADDREGFVTPESGSPTRRAGFARWRRWAASLRPWGAR